MKTLFTKSQVENLLPQKEPFAMVETLLEKENELFSTLMISADNLLVEQGCFSEAGLLEFMAQSIAVFSAYHSTEQEKEAQMGFIGAIKKPTAHVNITKDITLGFIKLKKAPK